MTTAETTRELLTLAEAAAARNSTRSDLADALSDAVALTRRDETAGVPALEAALAELAAFRHVIVSERGEVVGLSLFVRGLLDSASWAASDPARSRDDLARIAAAVAQIEQGDEAGVAELEAALAGRAARADLR